MEHEPSSFLSNAKSAVNLPRTNAILAVGNKPNAGKPFIQAERTILEDSSNLHGKLALCMMRTALPAQLVFEKANLVAPASRADNAIRPSTSRYIAEAVFGIREINDCFLKSLQFKDFVFHESKIQQFGGLVKDIIALVWDLGSAIPDK
jgi:hypothetical protein